MKKFLLLFLVVMLTACGAPAAATEQPVVAPPGPSATPVVIVQTVVVEATQAPTEVPPTAIPPTAIPPAAAPVVVTVVVEPTQQAPALVADTSGAPIALDNTLGKGVFVNMTMSSNSLTLRCSPRDITFTATAYDPLTVVDAEFYYRIVDLKRLYPSEWTRVGKMQSDGKGNFSIVFSGEGVHPSLRLDDSYLDFQIVGLNKGGGRVDATQKIEGLIRYTFDCR
jgi:hypothetical protein